MLDLSQIEQQINCDDRILAAYLFGSAVQDQLRLESDIDIALLPVSGKKLSPLDLLEMATLLTSSAGRTVDLGVMSSQNLIYSSQAILTGQRFWCRDQYEADLSLTHRVPVSVFRNKLTDAMQEASETQCWLEFACACRYISDDVFQNLDAEYESIIGMLSSMEMKSEKFCYTESGKAKGGKKEAKKVGN